MRVLLNMQRVEAEALLRDPDGWNLSGNGKVIRCRGGARINASMNKKRPRSFVAFFSHRSTIQNVIVTVFEHAEVLPVSQTW